MLDVLPGGTVRSAQDGLGAQFVQRHKHLLNRRLHAATAAAIRRRQQQQQQRGHNQYRQRSTRSPHTRQQGQPVQAVRVPTVRSHDQRVDVQVLEPGTRAPGQRGRHGGHVSVLCRAALQRAAICQAHIPGRSLKRSRSTGIDTHNSTQNIYIIYLTHSLSLSHPFFALF